MAELDTAGVAAVLAADTELEALSCGSALLGCDAYQLANAATVEGLEWVVVVNAQLDVLCQELAAIVTAKAAAHLGKVVGAEAEELCFCGDLVGCQCATRDFDHGSDLQIEGQFPGLLLGLDLRECVQNDLLLVGKLFDVADQRDHDFGLGALDGEGCLDDRTGRPCRAERTRAAAGRGSGQWRVGP